MLRGGICNALSLCRVLITARKATPLRMSISRVFWRAINTQLRLQKSLYIIDLALRFFALNTCI